MPDPSYLDTGDPLLDFGFTVMTYAAHQPSDMGAFAGLLASCEKPAEADHQRSLQIKPDQLRFPSSPTVVAPSPRPPKRNRDVVGEGNVLNDQEDKEEDRDKTYHAATLILAGPGGMPSATLHAAYNRQISVCVDRKLSELVYTFYTFRTAAFGERFMSLPSPSQLAAFTPILNAVNCLDGLNRHSDLFGDDDDDDDDDDDGDDDDDDDDYRDDGKNDNAGEYLDALAGDADKLDLDVRKLLCFQATAGGFFASRVLRMAVPLDAICGLRLYAPLARGSARAALLFELSAPPSASAFAARRAGGLHAHAPRFARTPDWTPRRAASRATRHYVVGAATDLQVVAGALASRDARLAAMLAAPGAPADNSLAAARSLLPGDAPPARAGARPARGKSGADAGRGLSADAVHDALRLYVGLSDEAVARGSSCFKRGVQLGHVDLRSLRPDAPFFSAKCLVCERAVQCTVRQAAEQADVGHDYGDDGTNGAMQCDGEGCGGFYLTGVCRGKPALTCGKFHNHCTDCDGFGQCIGDVRNSHCEDCGEHFFAGSCGNFPCHGCGGSNDDLRFEELLLEQMPPPDESVFDGVLRD